MGSKIHKNREHSDQLPSLEALISIIDRQVDQVPHPYAAEGFAALWGSRAREYKKQGLQYIRFLLSGTAFALPLQNALEIDSVPEVTPLPNLPRWVLGICNLRGDIFSVVDLKQILRLKQNTFDTVKKLILIHNEDTSTALVVDKVAGMLFADDQNIQTGRASTAAEAFSRFVRGDIEFDRQWVHLLDVAALMAALTL